MMKIFLQTPDSLIFLAGDGRESERVFSSAADFELTGELQNQIVRKVRGSHARAIARGNVRHQAFFRTRRLFPTPQEAENFVANAERSFPRAGLLYFVTGAGTRKLRNAVLKPPISTVRGCEARLQYTASGGDFTPLEPELVIEGIESLLLRMVSDDSGEWFEVGFLAPDNTLQGNAANGWTDADGHMVFRVQRSEDLVSWDHAVTDAPGSPVDNEDDTYTYWARILVPRLWKFVTIDLTATTTRYGKSITDVHLFGARLSLANYPYAMPADAAQLQTDLLALGYTGATVTTTAAPLTVGVKRHYQASSGYAVLDYTVTMSGSYVTEVRTDAGTLIPLSYPYAMPADRATLQADLETAGHSGAVVRLFGDMWTVFIPNRDTILNERRFEITFTPDDPFPQWNVFGDYNGLIPDNKLIGTSGNLRATTGLAPLVEANKQFARLGVSAGPNYLY